MTDPAQKSRTLLITALLATLAVAYVLFVFLPGQVAIEGLHSEVNEKQTYILQADDLTTSVRQTEEEIDAALRFVETWQAAAPSEAELADLFAGLNDAAIQAGVTISRFEPQPAVRSDTIWRLPVSIACEGSFAQTIEFLRRVEEMPAATWVSDLRLESTTDDRPRGDERREESSRSAVRDVEPSGESKLLGELTLWVFADNRDESN